MATKTPLRKRATNTFGLNRIRSAWVSVACVATLSTVTPLAPAVAQDAPSAIDQLDNVLSSNNPSIAELAMAIAKSQGEVADLEAQIGQFREDVNRALVDLQDARTQANQAREGASTAKDELDTAQGDLESAQERLNELSRAAYRRANTSEAVTSASGADARRDMLERQAYLRTQAEEQQGVVDGLDKVRTEKANKESQLRQARQLAETRETRASEAEAEARRLLEESQAKIEEISQERDALVEQERQAQEILDDARGVDSTPEQAQRPAQQGAQATNAAEREAAATNPAPASASATSAAPASASAAEAAPSATPEQSASEDSESALDNQETTQEATQVSDNVEAPTQSPEAASSASDVETALEMSSTVASQTQSPDAAAGNQQQGSSVGGITVNDALAFATTAASILAATQPDHTALDAPAVGTETGTPALQGPGTAPAEENALADEVSAVLEPISTVEEVSSDAQEQLGDLDRNAKIEAVIARAQSQIGTPYAWGGGNANGPTQGIRDGGVADRHGDYNKVGFDCSGLTLYAFAAAGISLPHYTGYQYNQGTKVPVSDIQRGDLLFWGANGGQHVAIYLGNGMMIEAPQSGQFVSEVPVRYGGMAPYAVRLL